MSRRPRRVEHGGMDILPTACMHPPGTAVARLRVTVLALALGATMASGPVPAQAPGRERGLMLAASLPPAHGLPTPRPVDEYWVSEKLDGVRARFDGRRLWTRGGLPV